MVGVGLNTKMSFRKSRFLLRSLTWLKNRQCQASTKVRAAVLKKGEDKFSIEEVKLPSTNKTKVRIRVNTVGLNTLDEYICVEEDEKSPGLSWWNLQSPKRPFIPGFELSGEVLEVGSEVKTFHIGDRVAALALGSWGGLAEECVVSQQDVWHLPPSVTFEMGAAAAYMYSTALWSLCWRYKIKEGSTLLISGAASGLGLSALDIAKVYRAKVIALCRSEERASFVRDRGAWAALTYDLKEMKSKTKEHTMGTGIDLAFDTMGGEVLKNMMECMAQEGTVLSAGWESELVSNVPTSALLPHSVSIIGVALYHLRVADPKQYRNVVEDMLDLCEQKLIHPHIHQSLPMDQINEAFDIMKKKKYTGKIIVRIPMD